MAETIFFSAQDVTDQLRSAEEIATQKELLDETENLLQYGSWNWNPTGALHMSAGIYSILGYPSGQATLTADQLLKMILPEYKDAAMELIESVLARPRDFETEICIESQSGVVKTVSIRGKVVFTHDGHIKNMIGVMRDVTSVRMLEEEQAKHLKELSRSNQELEEFAYVASHDLQEPLRKIAMFSERLHARCADKLDQEGRLFMDRILGSADNMRKLIDNLLEFSRANRSSKAYEKLHLKDVFEGVAANLELKIEETKTSLVFPSTLPVIEAVPSEMQQLFTNLVANSIKFRNPDRSPVIKISSRAATREEKRKFELNHKLTYQIITLEDNGIGFENEYAERIFQIFQRLHGKSEYPGSGIGLAICKRIVQNHNGIIMASGNPSVGSVFTIVIPDKQN